MNAQTPTLAVTRAVRRRVPTWVALAAGVLLGAVMMFVGLAQAGRIAPRPQPEVVVNLAQTLEVEHKRVDLLVEQEKFAEAIAALEQLRTLAWPGWQIEGDEVHIMRHDVYGRLLRLRLDHPDVDPRSDDELLKTAFEALTSGDGYTQVRTNPFTARLVAIRGEIHQKAGDDDKALDAYEEALTMNRELLQQALALPVTAPEEPAGEEESAP